MNITVQIHIEAEKTLNDDFFCSLRSQKEERVI
jgi:hypothetical protein